MDRIWGGFDAPPSKPRGFPRAPKGHVVYFIGGDCECVKIGFAKDPRKRLRSLQVGSPVPLFLLATVHGTVEHEKEYHQQFKESWSHGEWFRKTPKLLALIDALVRENNHARNMRGLRNG